MYLSKEPRRINVGKLTDDALVVIPSLIPSTGCLSQWANRVIAEEKAYRAVNETDPERFALLDVGPWCDGCIGAALMTTHVQSCGDRRTPVSAFFFDLHDWFVQVAFQRLKAFEVHNPKHADGDSASGSLATSGATASLN
ncbi:hypothetical protein [Schlesneria sp. DSM 10557]|uniref:hypothetical protein n=1 Tax=Schlesneria sp. DSM 10557 TaxID=3044399 RepID=UPI00359FA81E